MHVGGIEAVVVDRTNVEIAAVADAGEVHLRDAFGRRQQERAQRVLVRAKLVVAEEAIVGRKHGGPARDPFVVQRELAVRIEAAAPVAVADLSGIGIRVFLMNTVAADFIRAVDQALTEVDLAEHALPRCDARRNGHVVVRCDRPVERNLGAVAGVRVVARPRHQEAGLALHGRVGRREVRQVGEGMTEELYLRVFEVEHLFGLVVDDARGLHLPQRRVFGMVAARGAGGVGAALENRDVAIAAIGACRRHARFVRRVEAQ
ncbi:hypothetical protein BN961_01671 [Afipia felis]|uniref:Uncharacterized protein n=1 Tax=Afipia felis TaxID=1035 RepID=A0A090MPR9_AFIFE|nr:hypothetical protein BN961_01671 [Afipia felis]